MPAVPDNGPYPWESPARVRAAKIMQRIMEDLGRLSAIVPAGPLREHVDDETGHMASLYEEVGQMPHEED